MKNTIQSSNPNSGEIKENLRTVQGGTFISPRLKKQTDHIDVHGNKINPRTKQIIEQAQN